MNLPQVEGGWRTVLADPPWRYMGGVGNPEGTSRPWLDNLSPSKFRYKTMKLRDITAVPIAQHVAEDCHLYLWTPNALLPQALEVMRAWSFTYKSNVVWVKRRNDGGVYGGGLGNYFRNATELCLFGIRGKAKFGPATHGRHNVIETLRLQHSCKPEGLHELIEHVSPGPYLELFARRSHDGWAVWGDEL